MSGTAPYKGYNFDRNLAFCEDMTLAASDIVALSGTDVMLQIGPGRMDATLVLNITSIEIASNDELYRFLLQGSDSSTFASGIVNLADISFGAKEVLPPGSSAIDVDSVIGLQDVPFHNVVGGLMYDYVRLNVIISGTVAVGITFDAWIAPHSR